MWLQAGHKCPKPIKNSINQIYGISILKKSRIQDTHIIILIDEMDALYQYINNETFIYEKFWTTSKPITRAKNDTDISG